MRSNTCKLNKGLNCLENVLKEVEKVAVYNELEGKNALKLRLLTEELCGMLPGLVEKFDGRFWAESENGEFTLHVELEADNMSYEMRDELITVSKSGKNNAAKGVMGKIRAVAETMMLAASYPEAASPMGDYYDYHGYNIGFGYVDPAIAVETGYMYSWSLFSYKANVGNDESDGALAELERSIVAKLADDIIVGVRGKNVEIVVKKIF